MAVVACLHDVAVVREAVEQGGRHLRVAEHRRPFGEVQVGGDRRRTVTAERDRLRKQYAAFAALYRDQAATDAIACQRVADRSAVLAAMAARSRELLEGGRLVVEGRDNEVQLLLDTVSNDRALFAPPALPTASP